MNRCIDIGDSDYDLLARIGPSVTGAIRRVAAALRDAGGGDGVRGFEKLSGGRAQGAAKIPVPVSRAVRFTNRGRPRDGEANIAAWIYQQRRAPDCHARLRAPLDTLPLSTPAQLYLRHRLSAAGFKRFGRGEAWIRRALETVRQWEDDDMFG